MVSVSDKVVHNTQPGSCNGSSAQKGIQQEIILHRAWVWGLLVLEVKKAEFVLSASCVGVVDSQPALYVAV